MINLDRLKIINLVLLTIALVSFGESPIIAEDNQHNKAGATDKVIKGKSGGAVDSQGCGFIASSPNYEMNLERRLDYMRLTVKSAGGQPTLLVLGPNAEDSFCVLGDEISGLKPEISGVWESGSYQIFVGDRQGDRYQFTLDISTEN